jgi:hypothetical protein
MLPAFYVLDGRHLRAAKAMAITKQTMTTMSGQREKVVGNEGAIEGSVQ